MSMPNQTQIYKFIKVMRREAYAIMTYVNDHHEEMDLLEIRECWNRIVDLIQTMNSMVICHLEYDEDIEEWNASCAVMWDYAHQVRTYFE